MKQKRRRKEEQSEDRLDPPSRSVMVLSFLDKVRSAVSALTSAWKQVSKV